jgi:hypothetical protein
MYPKGVELADDIHSHGFDFFSGVVQGELTNRQYYPDWSQQVPDGEGLAGYEGRVNIIGDNETERVMDAVIPVPPSTASEVGRGERYSMPPKNYFHAAEVESGVPTVTIFCKTPTYDNNDGLSLTL